MKDTFLFSKFDKLRESDMDGGVKRKIITDEKDKVGKKPRKGYPVTSSSEEKDTTAIVFSLDEDCGALADALNIFKRRQINLKHIESRPSKTNKKDYEFYVEIDQKCNDIQSIKLVIEDLKAKAKSVVLHTEQSIPWFPRKISDLDKFADRVLSYGSDLDSDHPGFTDTVYRARRKEFADIAINYRYGQPLPRVEYTEEEIGVWNTVFTELTTLFPTHACHEVNYVFPLLVENCNYKLGTIPQLEEVSKFLKDCTGFTLRPVAGLLSSRDFLAGLAFRVFHSTQYIRHSKNPMYTPEPDCVHELIGHVPLFADPSFAQFSQEIGLASLGAPDEWIKKLATLYWFTVEFGMCRQNGELKAYGAGLLSSFGELQYCLTDKPEHLPFEPESISGTEYPITEYQPKYFVAESFEDAKNKVRQWSQSIPRPFSLYYNPYTQNVESSSKKDELLKLVNGVKEDINRVSATLAKNIS